MDSIIPVAANSSISVLAQFGEASCLCLGKGQALDGVHMNALKSDEFVKRPHAAYAAYLISRPAEPNVVLAMGILASEMDYAITSLMSCPLSDSLCGQVLKSGIPIGHRTSDFVYEAIHECLSPGHVMVVFWAEDTLHGKLKDTSEIQQHHIPNGDELVHAYPRPYARAQLRNTGISAIAQVHVRNALRAHSAISGLPKRRGA